MAFHHSILQRKNNRRLCLLTKITFVLGVNITSPSTRKDALRIISVFLMVIGCMDLYGHIAFIYRHRHSILTAAESIGTFLQTLLAILKLGYFCFVQRRFHFILNKVKTHELVDKISLLSNVTPYNEQLRSEARKILDRCWNIALKQFYYYTISVACIVSWYVFGALAINTYQAYIGNTNHTNILGKALNPLCVANVIFSLGVAFPTLFPFCEDRMNEFPCYPILTFVVGTSVIVAGLGAISFDTMFLFISLHIVALFRILRKMIRFTSTAPKELRLDYLRECILHFERTYQFCLELNNLYMHMSLVIFLCSLIIYGTVVLQLTFGFETDFVIFVRKVIYICAAGYSVVIFCWNSQLITDEADALSFTWYDCEWYSESREFKWLIHMMIMRSNRTLHMKCSWFTTMSLPTLMSIIRTSSSCFLLLRNFAFDNVN